MSEYHDNSPEPIRFAISALQDRLDKLTAPAASPEVMEVDDAMVELALAAFDKEVGWNQNDYLGNSIKERNLDAMRAAILAALSGKGKSL